MGGGKPRVQSACSSDTLIIYTQCNNVLRRDRGSPASHHPIVQWLEYSLGCWETPLQSFLRPLAEEGIEVGHPTSQMSVLTAGLKVIQSYKLLLPDFEWNLSL